MEKKDEIIEYVRETYIVNYPDYAGLLILKNINLEGFLSNISTVIPLFNTKEEAEDFVKLYNLKGAIINRLSVDYPTFAYGGN